MGKKTVRGHDIANRFVYSLSTESSAVPLFLTIFFDLFHNFYSDLLCDPVFDFRSIPYFQSRF